MFTLNGFQKRQYVVLKLSSFIVNNNQWGVANFRLTKTTSHFVLTGNTNVVTTDSYFDSHFMNFLLFDDVINRHFDKMCSLLKYITLNISFQFDLKCCFKFSLFFFISLVNLKHTYIKFIHNSFGAKYYLKFNIMEYKLS